MTPLETDGRYSELVTRDAGANLAALREALAARGLQGVRALDRPVFLGPSHRALLSRAAFLVGSALRRVGRALYDGGHFAKIFRFSPRAAELAATDSRRGPLLVFARLDVVLELATPRLTVLGCHAGTASGPGIHDPLVEAFLSLPALSALREETRLRVLPLFASHRRVLLGGGEEGATVRFAVSSDSPRRDDFEHLARQYLEAGLPAAVADPCDFSYGGEGLCHRGVAVTHVVRDAMGVRDADVGRLAPLRDASRDAKVVLANPFCAMFADQNAALEVLSDETHETLFSPDEREALRSHVPFTRVVRHARAVVRGRPVDLPAHLAAHKDDLVLKPNEGGAGKGVLIGRDASPGEWDTALARALADPGSMVAQELVPLAHTGVCGAARAMGPSSAVLGVFLHGSSFAGALSRVSPDPVKSVHRGVGLAPVLFLE